MTAYEMLMSDWSSDVCSSDLPLPAGTASVAGTAQRFVVDAAVPERWWTTFGNAELDRRVDTALRHSPSLAAAQAALRQAQENARAAGAVRLDRKSVR